MRVRILMVLAWAGVAGAQALPTLDALVAIAPGEPVQFSKDVRPILADKCFACHGPDASARKANLRLDTEADAFAALGSGEGYALVRGDLAASAAFHRITTTDPDEQMPPAEAKKPISATEVETLARWIQKGGAWEGHWSFIRPQRPTPPEVSNPDWAANPVDRFLLARLEAEALPHSPQADDRTLIRRITLDLTGLPPTPAEVEAYVADTTANKYDLLVDRLLASPRYGEHMARYWMDAARFADTNGYHIDNERYMWRWRDWVIESFNANQPFDQFTIEQLAGDLLENATLDQRIASGFNRNHMVNFEGGAIPEEYRMAYVADRTNTTGTVWMGLTVGCAQCHTHKYDPISHEEYYKLYSYFNTVDEQGLDGLKGNAVPMIKAPRAEDEAKLAALDEKIVAARAAIEAPDPTLDEAQAAWEREAHRKVSKRWQPARVGAKSSSGCATLDLLPDGSVLASGTNPATDIYTVELDSKLTRVTAIRLEALAHDSFANKGGGRSSNSNFVLTSFEVQSAPAGTEEWQPVKLADARADFSQDTFPVKNAIDADPATGWASAGNERPEDRVAIFLPEYPIAHSGGVRLRVVMKHESQFGQHAIGRFRLRVTEDNAYQRAALDGWHLNGPYAAATPDVVYDTAYAPEQAVNLTETYEDGRSKWNKLMRFEDGVIQPLEGGVVATYLYREINAPTARSIAVDLGSNDALKVWVNGALVHEVKQGRSITAGQYDRVNLPLREGVNQVLAKVVNYGNKHEFYFAAVEEQYDTMPAGVETALARRPAQRTDAERLALLYHYRQNNVPEWQASKAAFDALTVERKAAEEAMPTTMVMAEMATPRETFILARGEYDQPGAKVEPGVPAALPPLPEGVPNNRLGLAKWLVSAENPLTSRVTVNRFWQQFFGTGLVKTAEDFGLQGEAPSHPELLDWLAVDFVESGWDVKRFVKLLVTSAAYRQESRVRPELFERDPENRLVARGPRFRMDAEMVRDNALSIAGLLVEKVGGPSVKPYQPVGLWEESAYGGDFTAQTFVQDKGESLYRRTMYTFWKRQVPPPGMLLFDAPNRETCAVRRSRTNTPLQALMLMNDPQFVEASRFFAERILKESGATVEERIRQGFLLSLGRPPKAEEFAIVQTMYDQQRARFEGDAAAVEGLLKVGEKPANAEVPAAELAAWTTVASALLNLDEAITKL